MSSDSMLDICGKRTLEYVVECLALFNRGYDVITTRGFAGSIPKAISVAKILTESFGAEIFDSKVYFAKVGGMDSSIFQMNLKFNPVSQEPLSIDFSDGFVDYAYYHLLLDWHDAVEKSAKIARRDESTVNDAQGQPRISGKWIHVLNVWESQGDLVCLRNHSSSSSVDKQSQVFSAISEALYRSGFMFPSNWRDLIKKLSQYDDCVLGIDTNVLYVCNVSEHLLPLLSIAYPKKNISTPSWALLVVPSAVMHELEEAANVRDDRGFLQTEGRIGFRAMQEIIELSQGTDIPGVALIIVGEANPMLDTRVELQGLRADLCKREYNPYDRRTKRSFKKSTGDMIIRDQYKAFLRGLDFHKGCYFITGDKSNAALARTEAVNPIFLRRPDSISADVRDIPNPKIPTDQAEPLRFKVPLGKLLFEVAVTFGHISVEIGSRTINVGSDLRGERLDHWVNRDLIIDQNSRTQLLEGYKGRINPGFVVRKLRKIQDEFIGLDV